MKNKFRFAALISLILAAALTFSSCSLVSSLGGKDKEGNGAKPSAGENTEQGNNTEPEDDEPSLSVGVGTFLDYANDSVGLWEFMQRFFEDKIVYKNSKGDFVLGEINKDIPQCTYDYDNLVKPDENSKFVCYKEGDTVTSHAGIDVSQYNGDIDWDLVAQSGVEFVFIRAGYRGYGSGKLVQDTAFEANIQGALKAGIEVGVYFVTQAVNEEEAKEEAEFVAAMCRPYNVTWPVVLDIEATSSDEPRTKDLTADQRTTNIIAFCERCKELGYTPMLYANIGWFVDRMDLSRLAEYPKWFAQYFNRPFFPYEYQVWQYSNTGSVDGIKGNVDLNLAFKNFGKEE